MKLNRTKSTKKRRFPFTEEEMANAFERLLKAGERSMAFVVSAVFFVKWFATAVVLILSRAGAGRRDSWPGRAFP